jgi:hypothetical protein
VDLEDVVFIYNGILFSHKEGKWMELENIILNEVSQVPKTKDCVFLLIQIQGIL